MNRSTIISSSSSFHNTDYVKAISQNIDYLGRLTAEYILSQGNQLSGEELDQLK